MMILSIRDTVYVRVSAFLCRCEFSFLPLISACTFHPINGQDRGASGVKKAIDMICTSRSR